MNRRGAIRSLLSAPLAASLGVNTGATNMVSGAVDGVGGVEFREPSLLEQYWRRKLHDDQPRHLDHSLLPARIRCKKSWSDAYKEHVNQEEWKRYSELERLLSDFSYGGDPIKAAKAAKRLAEVFGSVSE